MRCGNVLGQASLWWDQSGGPAVLHSGLPFAEGLVESHQRGKFAPAKPSLKEHEKAITVAADERATMPSLLRRLEKLVATCDITVATSFTAVVTRGDIVLSPLPAEGISPRPPQML